MAVGYRALKDKLIVDLSTVFARQSQLREANLAIEQMKTIAISANDLGAQNTDAIIRLQETVPLTHKQITRSLDRIDERLNQMDHNNMAMQKEIAVTVTILAKLEERVDRHVNGKRE